MSLDWTTIGTALGGLACAAWAGVNHFRFERQKDRRANEEKVEKAHSEVEKAHVELMEATVARINTIEKDRDAWKERYDGLHGEFGTYREKSHRQINDAQALILKLTDENSMLKAKTDLTPILKFQEEQGVINTKVVTALDALLKKIEH